MGNDTGGIIRYILLDDFHYNSFCPTTLFSLYSNLKSLVKIDISTLNTACTSILESNMIIIVG